jgi:acyl-coenzyme A thioesterase PaaI-like protein
MVNYTMWVLLQPLTCPGLFLLTLQGMQLVSSRAGHISCSLQVTPQLQNRYGTLHGGAIGAV